MAKGVLLHLARTRGVADRLHIDSCGTGSWHVGGPADPRTLAVMAAKGIPLDHVARQFAIAPDLGRFDWILAMDRANVRDLVRAGTPRVRVRMLREFDPALAAADEAAWDVPDPYYGGPEGFTRMHEMIHAACDGFLDHLAASGRLA
jgi:protein-tyrosine phosphatase